MILIHIAMAERGRDREGDGYRRGNLHVASTSSSDGMLEPQHPSTDEDIRTILSVTPVNVPSSDNDGGMQDDERSVELEDDEVMSSSSSASQSDRSTDEEEGEDSNEDSIHSDDEMEDNDEVPVEPPQSEWDKALRSGKPSQGRAADFFVSPLLSTDSSEFYSTAQAARATAPGELRSPRNRLPRSTNTPRSQANGSASATSQTTAPPRVPTTGEVMAKGNHRSARANHIPALPMPPSESSMAASATARPHDYYPASSHHMEADDDHLNAGVLPDMLMTMRQRIESINMFDSDILRMTNDYVKNNDDDEDSIFQESRESLKRSSQQSISAAVLVSLAHKRYERRRLAAMEIEKVVRSLVVLQHQTKAAGNSNNELDRVRAILLLLSDDYVRSTNEDARKGGVVALAACAIGLKKAPDQDATVQECRDLILASVVHACQDHSQRVRYYATESLFNVVKGMFRMDETNLYWSYSC
jgi:Vacuolar 14 Fab1-binding region